MDKSRECARRCWRGITGPWTPLAALGPSGHFAQLPETPPPPPRVAATRVALSQAQFSAVSTQFCCELRVSVCVSHTTTAAATAAANPDWLVAFHIYLCPHLVELTRGVQLASQPGTKKISLPAVSSCLADASFCPASSRPLSDAPLGIGIVN